MKESKQENKDIIELTSLVKTDDTEQADFPVGIDRSDLAVRSQSIERTTTEIPPLEDDTMSGGYASVKGRSVGGNITVWIVVAVMAVICILTGVISSVLTAYFMKKGSTPAGIIADDRKQSVAAVVAARESSIVEVVSGSLHGSGVITKLDNNKIYIVTNAHVINGNANAAVRFYGEDDYFRADTVGYSTYYDVAVLTVTHKTLYEIFDLDGSDYFTADVSYNTGDYVVAIGNAMSLGVAAYDGIVSRKSELLDYEQKTIPVLRTTAAVNAGMSGGALFDMEGRFIGLTTYRMTSTSTNSDSHKDDVEDTGYAIPAAVVYPVYKQICEFGDGGEIGLVGMRFYRASTSAVGGIIMRNFGFTCEYRNGQLEVVALDAVSSPYNFAVGDIIVKIGAYDVTDDICKTGGYVLHYRQGSYTGAALQFELKRDGSSVTVYIDGFYNYVS